MGRAIITKANHPSLNKYGEVISEKISTSVTPMGASAELKAIFSLNSSINVKDLEQTTQFFS